jgi:hypothetical protein
VNKFRERMIQWLHMMDELDTTKKLQYGCVESSLKLMANNLREPTEVHAQGDGPRRATGTGKKVVAAPATDDPAHAWLASKSIVYHNVYGQNPAKGTVEYDLTDEAARA